MELFSGFDSSFVFWNWTFLSFWVCGAGRNELLCVFYSEQTWMSSTWIRFICPCSFPGVHAVSVEIKEDLMLFKLCSSSVILYNGNEARNLNWVTCCFKVNPSLLLHFYWISQSRRNLVKHAGASDDLRALYPTVFWISFDHPLDYFPVRRLLPTRPGAAAPSHVWDYCLCHPHASSWLLSNPEGLYDYDDEGVWMMSPD